MPIREVTKYCATCETCGAEAIYYAPGEPVKHLPEGWTSTNEGDYWFHRRTYCPRCSGNEEETNE